MLVADLIALLERSAPLSLAQPGDNCGLLIGVRTAPVKRIMAALEVTAAVVDEAADRGCDTIITHHPLLYAPVHSLVEERPREQAIRRLVRGGINLLAWHTNLDAAPGGLAALCAEALGLRDPVPLQRVAAGWYKLVGFIPPEALERVAAAVFEAGAGRIGDYRECAYALEGTGWFTPEPGAHPTIGSISVPERTAEVRWETVVPRGRLAAVVSAFVWAHPYEEPAFDIYPVEDVIPGAGLGRVGDLAQPLTVPSLAAKVAREFVLPTCQWTTSAQGRVTRVAVLPGSGRSLLDIAASVAEVLVTGDLTYHEAERAAEQGLALILAPHGELEWWAFQEWAKRLGPLVAAQGGEVLLSNSWRSPWVQTSSVSYAADGSANLKDDAGRASTETETRAVILRIDGGSRGNPGPGAIGVVMEDKTGRVLATLGRVIGVVTNNVAEYEALLAGLRLAREAGADEVEVRADSELLVKQMRGEYAVRNDGLKPLHQEAQKMAGRFRRFAIRHVPREENMAADAVVNKALDEAAAG